MLPAGPRKHLRNRLEAWTLPAALLSHTSGTGEHGKRGQFPGRKARWGLVL